MSLEDEVRELKQVVQNTGYEMGRISATLEEVKNLFAEYINMTRTLRVITEEQRNGDG